MRDFIENGIIKLDFKSMKDMVVDELIKSLAGISFRNFIKMLGFREAISIGGSE